MMPAMSEENAVAVRPSIGDLTQISGRNRWRLLLDQIARHAIAFGGSGVIIAVVLIFFYLLYVVYPMLQSPEQIVHRV